MDEHHRRGLAQAELDFKATRDAPTPERMIFDIAQALTEHSNATPYEALQQAPDVLAKLRALGWQIVPAHGDEEWR